MFEIVTFNGQELELKSINRQKYFQRPNWEGRLDMLVQIKLTVYIKLTQTSSHRI